MTLCPELSRESEGSVSGLTVVSFRHHGQQQHAMELRSSSSIHPCCGGDSGAHHIPPGGLQYTLFPHVHQHSVVSFQQWSRHNRDAEESVTPPAHERFYPQPRRI